MINLPPLSIQITPTVNDDFWAHLWRTMEFENWGDVHGWLSDRYQAETIRMGTGFVIQFRDLESKTQFALEWLS